METTKAKHLPDGLTLVTDSHEVNRTLDHLGIDHDPGSIILEDSYGALFIGSEDGAYTEVWGVHESVVNDNSTAYKLV